MDQKRKIISNGLSLIVRGSFDPSIFSPTWFSLEGLIGKNLAETASLGVIHRDITKFKCEKMDFQIARDVLSFSTDDESSFEQLRDITCGVFTILDRTPVGVMGINYTTHFTIESEEKWHEIGHYLLPKEPWKDLLTNPGMRTVIIEGKNPCDEKGYVRIKVEPSFLAKLAISMEVNHHFTIGGDKNIDKTTQIVKTLKDNWKDVQDNAAKILNGVRGFKSE